MTMHGFSLGLKDTTLDKSRRLKIKNDIDQIMADARERTYKINKRQQQAPIDQTLREFNERLQLTALTAGDSFTKSIFGTD